MSNIDLFRSILEIIYYVAAIIGIPVAIVVFIHDKRQERRNREIDMYLHSADKYLSFLALSLEHPDLRCGDFMISDAPSVIESGFSTQELTLYEILLITLEQAYYLYTKNGLSSDGTFWHVWREYLQWLASRPDFRRAWNAIDPLLDPGFMKFMQSEFSKHTDEIAPNKVVQGTPANADAPDA